MTRQIKFRAQRTDNREWVYGYLTHLTGMPKECINQDGYYISDECGRQPVYLVEENTIGQFTGLYDKNGKEIYEGDIVQTDCSIGDIQFSHGVFGAEWTTSKESKSMIGVWGQRHNLRRLDDDDFIVEIIGNIHDNPDLLTTK